jgi:chorismate dehydratase
MHFALISFLNARPLWWGLTHAPSEGETFEFTLPARCADLVADGRAHLGLVPAIELARIPGVVALPSICIASRTEVRSVLLVSRVPFEEIRSVSLDPASRTSVALARILLGERLGPEVYAKIRFDPAERNRLVDLEGHDAAVVIGDPALQIAREPHRYAYRYDLVSEWNAMTGLPFVFAVWTGRRELLENNDCAALLRRLEASRDFGRGQLSAIAREASEEIGVPYGELMSYFTEALHYDLGAEERSALARFYSLARKYALIEAGREIEWLNCEAQ